MVSPEGGSSFDAMMKAMAAEDPDWQALRDMGGELMNQDGFLGPLRPVIEELTEAGMIRGFHIPVLAGNKFNGGEGVTPKREYRGLFFALKVDDDSFHTRTLLVFPRDDKPTVDIIEVEPARSFVGDALDIGPANQRFREEFYALTAPSKTPYVIPRWRPNPGETPYDSFRRNPADVLNGVALVYAARPVGENLRLLERQIGRPLDRPPETPGAAGVR